MYLCGVCLCVSVCVSVCVCLCMYLCVVCVRVCLCVCISIAKEQPCNRKVPGSMPGYAKLVLFP